MLSFWSEPGLADAEHVQEKKLDGLAPSRDKGGRGASGAVGLECADARGVEAFRRQVVSNARARAKVGVNKSADWEGEPFVIGGVGFFGRI